MSIFSKIVVFFLLFWHKYVSVAFGPACRHQPSCSIYGVEAIKKYGLIKGLGLALRRLGRCHPWGSHGFDPVP